MNLESRQDTHHWGIFKTSAVKSLEEGGIPEALHWLVEDIKHRVRFIPIDKED